LNTFGSSVHFASEGIHYWDVNCVDRNFNWADNNSGAQWDVNYYVASQAPAEPIYFAKRFGSTNSDSGSAIASDSFGNIYFSGSFYYNSSFGDFNLSSSAMQSFIAKIDSNGNYIWAVKSGALGDGIVVDSQSNVYLTGKFRSDAVFGDINLSYSGDPEEDSDIFVAKLDSDGEWVWVKGAGYGRSFGESAVFPDAGVGVALNSSGELYVSGYFSGKASFGDINIDAAGVGDDMDAFVAKVDAETGDWVWVKKVGGIFDETGSKITIDNSGNLYLAGNFNSNFKGSFSCDGLDVNSSGYGAVFVIKMSGDGNCISAQSASPASSGVIYVNDIVSDESTTYLTGYYTRGATFGDLNLSSIGSYYSNAFVAKFSDGNWVWAKRFGSFSVDGIQNEGHGLAIDSAGKLYLTGYFSGSVTCGSSVIAPVGKYDAFVAEFSSDGNCLWSSRGGGEAYDAGYGIAVNSEGKVFATGFFQGSEVSFDQDNFSSLGYNDGFVWKVRPAE
ncbi:MAG: SBBP repeat-containing protein, partial [archaeon]|jgi:hypothetical protein